tara:strand:- start:1721 stop:3811 length:2091 start_codon:yes stop_codon:yes gene_type:complete
MAKMTDKELVSLLTQAKEDCAIYTGEFMKENEKYLEAYLGLKTGEFSSVPEESSVVSNDVADVVEADMPSLARIFMGSGDILSFEANTENAAEVQEAEDKTKYVNWVVRNQPESFKIQHDWLKDAEIQKASVVKYFYEESKDVEVVEYEGLTEDELSEVVDSLKGPDIKKVEIIEQEVEDDFFNIKFKVTREIKRIKIVNVPPESFLISRNASSKQDAEVVGDISQPSRSQLLADGFDRELIDSLPSHDKDLNSRSRLNQIRNEDQGGSFSSETIADKASEKVEILDLYCRVDFDGDGIAEMRHIMISGNVLLVNEYFNHKPYAMLSAVLMPHKAIGRSRAEIAYPTQLEKTALKRGMMNNMYMTNKPRTVVHSSVNLDDMLTVRTNGIIRMDDENPNIIPQNAVYPLVTQYTGDKTLQVIQYADQQRANTTGALMSSQGLDADAISKETATRFSGVEKSGAAKIELIARNYAETGYRDLFEGIAWLAGRYQNTEIEFIVLGKAMKINPSKWKYNHTVRTNVGLGAGNNEALVASLQGIYQIQQQLKMSGSALVDEVDMFNTLKRITDGLGLPRANEFFNNPEEPDELLKAQNEQLNQMVLQLQEAMQQMQNPLAESEQIKAEASLIKAQSDAQIKMAEMEQKQQQFMAELSRKIEESDEKNALKLTELELNAGRDLNAEVADNMLVFDPQTGRFE